MNDSFRDFTAVSLFFLHCVAWKCSLKPVWIVRWDIDSESKMLGFFQCEACVVEHTRFRVLNAGFHGIMFLREIRKLKTAVIFVI